MNDLQLLSCFLCLLHNVAMIGKVLGLLALEETFAKQLFREQVSFWNRMMFFLDDLLATGQYLI